MSTEPETEGASSRHKFDDVASLFETIVPVPGAPARPVKPRIVPPSMPPEPETPVIRLTPAPPAAGEPPLLRQITPVPPRPQFRPEPAPPKEAAPRPRPTEIPWPDAFEPLPNYRKVEPRKWSWLLLIPTGIAAAIAISMVDVRAARIWFETNVLHHDVSDPALTSLLPIPPEAANPAIDDSAETSNPYPAVPTSPTAGAPSTTDTPAATAPAAVHVVIQFRRNIPGGEGEARRIANLLQGFGGSVELHPNDATTRVPTINYYNPADKDVAAGLAKALANEAISWSVRPGAIKYPQGTIDVWLP